MNAAKVSGDQYECAKKTRRLYPDCEHECKRKPFFGAAQFFGARQVEASLTHNQPAHAQGTQLAPLQTVAYQWRDGIACTSALGGWLSTRT